MHDYIHIDQVVNDCVERARRRLREDIEAGRLPHLGSHDLATFKGLCREGCLYTLREFRDNDSFLYEISRVRRSKAYKKDKRGKEIETNHVLLQLGDDLLVDPTITQFTDWRGSYCFAKYPLPITIVKDGKRDTTAEFKRHVEETWPLVNR